MNLSTLYFAPAVPIPDHLVGEVQSKLAYVDERIASAQISPAGDQISIDLKQPVAESERLAIEEKVQRVVVSMAKGAIRPRSSA